MSVSIIVPCYNVAPYVEACLDSLVNQSLRNIEIICVNDGSTDVTPALLDAWAERRTASASFTVKRRAGVGAEPRNGYGRR